ncbi:serine hydrolase domain-containing protein [Sphingomonas sp. 8AM]|uniref:serine hydrolase domain-containing protein n=1 Tax=Sphingomonas sp. 8AM TaxID=2653170 RepID=UPI0012F438F9|nr:serine hydrolase domain-containing protein [Sphingomonas sp. 8AM]VXC98987.1 CubicO group peptidase, beta-lactamase class C family [Sphingomonas sp. 8AM]
MGMGRMIAWLSAGLGAAALAAIAPAQAPVGPGAPAVAQPAAPATAGTPGGAHALTSGDVSAWLDGYLPYALHSGDIAGAVVMVVRDGQVIAARGYGYADVAKRRPVDPARTLFRPGSVSKLVTWTAVMQQVEAGRIDLDTDVNRYLDFTIPPYRGRPVTMRHIMTHTAGFEEANKKLITYDVRDVQPIGAYLKRHIPARVYVPGTTPAYSNWATTLAGYIVERVSGMPFDDYVEQRIFRPLDMQTASFRQPLPSRLRGSMAQGYPLGSGAPKPFEIVVPGPAGSLSASGLDMAKFMIAHLDGGRGVLRPETAVLMHDSPLAKVDPRSLIPPLNRMELGFFETNINGRSVIAHLGDTNQMHTSLHLFMNERTGLYVSFNSAGRDGAAHVLRGQLFQDFADRYFPGAPRDTRVDATTAHAHAAAMAGHWQVSRSSFTNFVDVLNLFGQAEAGVDAEGRLVIPSLKGANGVPIAWVETAPYVWRDPAGHDRLAAQLVDGQPVRWSFDLVAPFMVWDRVPARSNAAWLVPALYASLAVLLLTVLFWPANWYLRRRYQAAAPVAGAALRTVRAARGMALAVLLVLGGWFWLISVLFGDNAPGDGWLTLAQLASNLVFVGAVAVAGWNALVSWRSDRPWPRKLWAVLLLLATLVVLWVAAVFHLLALTVYY